MRGKPILNTAYAALRLLHDEEFIDFAVIGGPAMGAHSVVIRRRRQTTVRPVFERMRFFRVAFPLAGLAQRYTTMLMLLYPTEQEHFQNQPHRIVLTSAILHTRELTMDVKNGWHGENWLKQIADDETEIDSQGTWWCTGAPVTGLPQLWSAFAEASIRMERIAGGCLRHRVQ